MSINVSFINMKGGVGKTTLAMQVAFGAQAAGLRVLAVDLDPQSNLSQALLGTELYRKGVIDQNRPTVIQLFEGYLPATQTRPGPSTVSVEDAIMKPLSEKFPHLVPSRLQLCHTIRNPGGKERRLAEAVAKVQDRYDIVIIDCAPTDSMLTDAAYFASRYVVVPVKPEYLAAIGIPLLARSLKGFKQANQDHTIDIAGIVFVHSSDYSVSPEGRESIAEVSKTAKEEGWRVFTKEIPYSRSVAKSAREGRPIGWTRRARPKVVTAFSAFTNELFGAVGIGERLPEAAEPFAEF
jgi:chromosome partitioning protein